MANKIRRGSLLLALSATAFSQVPSRAVFEVASVRPNVADDRIVTIEVGPGGRFAARGYTLVLLMQRAYGVMNWNVSGGPEWIRSDRYDITANAPVSGNLTESQLRPMLQALLADRFKLRIHKSSKEMAGYALVEAKRGAKVKATVGDEEHPDSFRLNQSGLTGQGVNMVDFARYVGGKLGLVAVDKTGLKGAYDFRAEWKVDPDRPDAREELRSVVLAALEEQLGLKLVPQKITVEMLVIDSVEKASSN